MNTRKAIRKPPNLMKPNRLTRILMISLMLGMGMKLQAQEFKAKLIGGLYASQIEGDKLVGFNKPGLVGGVGASFPLGDSWSLEPEILYSQKGSRSSEQEQLRFNRTETIALDYIEMPLIANYKLRDDLVFQFGLSPNLLINAQVDDGLGRGFQNTRSQFRDWDFCSVLGAEYILYERWGLNIRWVYTLFPVNTVEDSSNLNAVNPPLYGYTGMFNNALLFSARYYINL